MHLIEQFYKFEAQWPCISWFARVPSRSNPADLPTRGLHSELAKAICGRIIAPPELLTCVWKLPDARAVVMQCTKGGDRTP